MKFNGLGMALEVGVGSEVGGGVGLSRWGVYTHGALLLQEDHEINMLRKLEPCLFTQEELTHHQQRERTGSLSSQLPSHALKAMNIMVDGVDDDDDIDNSSAEIRNEEEEANSSLQHNIVTQNHEEKDQDQDQDNIQHDTTWLSCDASGVSWDMERVVRHVLTQPPESHAIRSLASSPTISTHQPSSAMFTLPFPSLHTMNANMPRLPAAMQKSATAMLSSAMTSLSNMSSPVKSDRAQSNISVESDRAQSNISVKSDRAQANISVKSAVIPENFSNETSPLSSPVNSPSQTSARPPAKYPSRFLSQSSQMSLMSAATTAVSSAKDTLASTATRVKASATRVHPPYRNISSLITTMQIMLYLPPSIPHHPFDCSLLVTHYSLLD